MANATSTTIGGIRLAGDLAGSNDALAPQLTSSGVVAGTYTNPTLTFNSKGLVTSASNGSSIDIFNIPAAGSSQPGYVTIGSNINVSSGVISIPLATTSSLGIMQVGSGLVVSSGVVSVNTSIHPTLSNGGTFNGSISTTPAVISANGPTTLSCTASNVFDVTLTGNITLNIPSNLIVGAVFFVILRQDAAGNRTCTFDSAFKFENGTINTLTSTPNGIDLLRVCVSSPTQLISKLYKNFV